MPAAVPAVILAALLRSRQDCSSEGIPIFTELTLTVRRRLLPFAIVATLAILVSACACDGGTLTRSEEETGTELALDDS